MITMNVSADCGDSDGDYGDGVVMLMMMMELLLGTRGAGFRK